MNTKICPVCGEEKSLKDFYLRKDRKSGQAVESRCKECSKKRNNNTVTGELRKTTRGSLEVRAKRYQLEVNDVLDYYDTHDGLCDICRKSSEDNRFGRLYIDHDHETGEFRGFLCGDCNSGIGYLKDNILIMENAIAYLKKGISK